MERFVATCSACQWESPVADMAEVAAVAGVGHLQAVHGAVLAAGDVSYIRVWSFQQLRVSVGTADVTLEEETPAVHEPPAKHAEHDRHTDSEAHHKGKKGR